MAGRCARARSLSRTIQHTHTHTVRLHNCNLLRHWVILEFIAAYAREQHIYILYKCTTYEQVYKRKPSDTN